MSRDDARKPLVYSCSGCSSAAQLANQLAVSLDREGEFEMSCIAGVGAQLPNFVREAKTAPAVLCLDGCSLKCAARCLESIGVAPSAHLVLSEIGVGKRKHEPATDAEHVRATKAVRALIAKTRAKAVKATKATKATES